MTLSHKFRTVQSMEYEIISLHLSMNVLAHDTVFSWNFGNLYNSLAMSLNFDCIQDCHMVSLQMDCHVLGFLFLCP